MAGGGLSDEVQKALNILIGAGVIDEGTMQKDEFFVLRLKDEFALPALLAYARAAARWDAQYAQEVQELAVRSGPYNAFCRTPD